MICEKMLFRLRAGLTFGCMGQPTLSLVHPHRSQLKWSCVRGTHVWCDRNCPRDRLEPVVWGGSWKPLSVPGPAPT